MAVIIETSGLSRTYQTYKKPEGLWNSVRGFWNRKYEQKIALSPTDLKIEDGQIVGLVGANGAGKTTLLKLLCGLIHPSSGTAKVLGVSPWERQRDFLKHISILLGQKNQLWWDIPPADSFELLARIYDIPFDEAKKRVKELAELLKCTEQLHVQLRRLSLGERMKMEIIGSLLHRPKVLFLDEPTIGLDIVAQSTIRDFLSRYVQQYRPTIILTSHYMDDISKLADRLLLISRGRIVYDGTVASFVSQAEISQKLSMRLETPLSHDLPIMDGVTLSAGSQIIEMELPAKKVGQALEKILSRSPVQDLKVEEAGFEDVIHRFLEKDDRHGPVGNSLTI
ncbi:MAG: ATP-binding cassette domain-containing protein [Bdellovibrionales bacterium]